MKKKGFTLIELLAVIVILAVIALIATPLVLNTVNDAKDGALKATTRTIIEEAEKVYVQKLRNDPLNVPTVLPSEVKYSGEQIEEGNLKLSFNDMGLANIALYKDAKCVYKKASDKDVTLEKNIPLQECLDKIEGITDEPGSGGNEGSGGESGSGGGSGSANTGASMLISKANGVDATYSNTTKGEMFAFSHPATEQTPETTDYRYIGDAPNNYITFNDEKWRIIGVFDGRIKIIKEERISDTNIYWDYKKNGVGSSTTNYGSNDWSDSQLMYMLNPTTYTLKSGYRLDGNYIKDANGNIIYQSGCRPASIKSGATSYSCKTNNWSLNSEALSQIDTVTYYLGGTSSVSAESYYAFERGTTVYSGCPTSWQGKVGLMYPSDYGYTFAKGIDNTCYTNLRNCKSGTPRTVSPDSGNAGTVFRVNSAGRVDRSYADGTYGVRPVAYLRSDIQLTGTGASTDPYRIAN